MSGAYAQSGVDAGAADRAVGALVSVLRTIDPGRASRSVLPSGHYAAVLEVAPNLGIAVGTDGVGSKLIVAEQTGRYDTVGIDCVAMNVNDVVCVGAEPIALLDYLAVEQVEPEVMEAIGVGLKAGAEAAGVEIPGGELAVLPELIRGHPSPGGFDLCGTAFGTVALDAIITGEAIAPGDAVIGLPSSGLHSNSYSLARRTGGAGDHAVQRHGAEARGGEVEPARRRVALDQLRQDGDLAARDLHPGVLRAGGQAAPDRGEHVGVGPLDRDVVEQRDRLRADAHDVVDVHRHAVDPDGVEPPGLLGDDELGAHAVGADRDPEVRRHLEDRRVVTRAQAGARGSSGVDPAQHADERGHRPVGRTRVDPGGGVGVAHRERFCRTRQMAAASAIRYAAQTA